MKRKGNIYQSIIHPQNLIVADNKARKGKKGKKDVKQHDAQRGCNILALHNQLAARAFTTSAYSTFTVFEPKERVVYCLPYYPDRIVHHAVMNKLETLFVACFTADSYSCIKGKGIHAAAASLKQVVQGANAPAYCLKLDITKFYPSVNHDVLKAQLRRKLKDADLLWLLDNIIDSADGLPIGNYLSQYLANYYLTGFDHWIKEQLDVKHYWRYADDMVILHHDKKYLHVLLSAIRTYLDINLNLSIKPNYQVFPIAKRGIDFLGYVFYPTHTSLRKTIKQNMARRRHIPTSAASYYGWAKHCDSRHLLKKLNTHATIQRLKHKSRNKGDDGRQDQNRPHTEHPNYSARVPNRAEPVQGRLFTATN